MEIVFPPTFTVVVAPPVAVLVSVWYGCADVICCPGDTGVDPVLCACWSCCAVWDSIPDPVISCGLIWGPCRWALLSLLQASSSPIMGHAIACIQARSASVCRWITISPVL